MPSHLEEAELFLGQQDSIITRLIILTYQNKEQIRQKKKAVFSLEIRVIEVKAGRIHPSTVQERNEANGF